MIRGHGVRNKPKNALSSCNEGMRVLGARISCRRWAVGQAPALQYSRRRRHDGGSAPAPLAPDFPVQRRRTCLSMIEFGHLSHVGLRRDLNEDTYDANAEHGLWLVADGMGGHEYGEVASAMACAAAMESARAGSSLSDAIR